MEGQRRLDLPRLDAHAVQLDLLVDPPQELDRPVGPMDVIATMTKAMGLDLATQWTTPRGRPIKLVDGGTPIQELI